jgi:paraquat-inducible protein B
MLNRILQTSAIVALLLLSLVLWDLHQLAREARVSLLLTDPVLGNINAAASNLTAAAGAIGTVARSANAGLVAETKRLNAGTLELQKTEASARLLIVRTNESLNGGPDVKSPLLPAAANALNRMTADVDDVTAGLAPSLQNLQQGSAAFAAAAADPNIRKSLDSLAASSLEAAETLQEAHRSLTDVREMADKARETYLKPVNLWWAVLKELLPLAGSAAQVVK